MVEGQGVSPSGFGFGFWSGCHHPKEVTGLVHRCWDEFWSHQSRDHDTIAQNLVAAAHVPAAEIEWESLSLEILIKTARTKMAGGASSVDQWHGEEIRHLPEPALEVFRQLAISWESAGAVPDQLLHSRMTNLPQKTEQGCLHIQDMRPVTVLACFWRLCASSYFQTPSYKSWVASLPPELVG